MHADNGMYAVHVEDVHGLGYGMYTATTGPRNPIGGGINLLFGDTEPGTSDLAVHSFSTNTDYTQRDFGSAAHWLDPLGTVAPLGTTGFRTMYHVPSPDPLTIVEDVVANGTTFFDSNVTIRATITNDGEAPVAIGVRQLWDTEVAHDDGPTFQAQSPDGAVITDATTFAPPAFVSFRMTDNDTNPSPPTLVFTGSAANGAPPPSTLAYTCWRGVFDAPFLPASFGSGDVATTRGLCSPETGGDSAVAYYWGGGTGMTIAPHASVSVATVLGAVQSHPLPTTLVAEPAIARIGPGLTVNFPNLKATLRTSTGDGIPGKVIAFSAGGKFVCAAVTDANGLASCGGLTQALAVVLSLGYKANFAGDAGWLASSATGNLLVVGGLKL